MILRWLSVLSIICLLTMNLGCSGDAGTPGDENDPATTTDIEADAAEEANPTPVN